MTALPNSTGDFLLLGYLKLEEFINKKNSNISKIKKPKIMYFARNLLTLTLVFIASWL